MKAIIIGSGLSGLTAGAYLAKLGCDVTVLEQNSDIGGVTGGMSRDGFGWDLGQLIMEGFGPGEQAGYILEDLGIMDEVKTRRSDRTYVFPDITIRRPDEYGGPWWRKEFFKARFPGEQKGIDRYYRMYVRFMELMTLARKAERAAGAASFFLKVRLYAKLLPLLPRISWNAQKMIGKLFGDEKLQAVFISILADFVVKPSQFPGLGIPAVNPEPAFDSRVPLKVSGTGLQPSYRYIEGGTRPLVEALARMIKIHDGKILTNIEVQGIRPKDGMVKGVVSSNGTTYEADIVVASGGAREVFYDLLGQEHLPEKFIRRIESMKLMESILMVQLGIDFDPHPWQKDAVCYYYLTTDIEQAVDNLQSGLYHEGKDGFLIYIPTYYTPAMAPAGHHSVTVYTIAPNDMSGVAWEDKKEEMADKLLDLAEKIIPGLREHSKVKIILAPDDWKRISHLKHHAFGGCAPVMGTKGAPHRTPVKGLYFVGAQSESGAGINNVLEGTWRAVRMIRKDFRL
jgi:all-trans-retinol 13,14-reductase